MLEKCSEFPDIFNHIISFSNAFDLCNIICASKKLNRSIDNNYINEIQVHGFFVYDLVQWLRKYNIRSIKYLKISNYNVSNDHCMDNIYQVEGDLCDCVEDIITTLQSIEINTLIFSGVDLGSHFIVPRKLEKLSLINSDTSSSTIEWINGIDGLKELSLMLEYDPYHASYSSYLSNFIGLKNSSLSSFTTNYFYFMEDMSCFLNNSNENENLKVFSFETILDQEDYPPNINVLIKEKFPNCVIKCSS